MTAHQNDGQSMRASTSVGRVGGELSDHQHHGLCAEYARCQQGGCSKAVQGLGGWGLPPQWGGIFVVGHLGTLILPGVATKESGTCTGVVWF